MSGGIREDFELLRQQVEILFDRVGHLDGIDARPVNWTELDGGGAAEEWARLTHWVDWFIDRYQLTETLPSCWYEHPPIVEELSALHIAWLGAYCDPGASANDGVAFHDMAERVLDRIQQADRPGCASAGAHREDIAAPPNATRLSARAEAIRTDIAVRPRAISTDNGAPSAPAGDTE